MFFFFGHAVGNAQLRGDLGGLLLPAVIFRTGAAQGHGPCFGDIWRMPGCVNDAQVFALQPQRQAVEEGFNARTLQGVGGANKLAVFGRVAGHTLLQRTSQRRLWGRGAAG